MHLTEVNGKERNESSQRVADKLKRGLGDTVINLLDEKAVIEIVLNPDGNIWVERLGHRMEKVGRFDASKAEALMLTVASILKTQMTKDNPVLECELPLDGSRFEALLPPIVTAPTFAIRKRASSVFSLDDYVTGKIISDRQADLIKAAVKSKKNILVVGGTGSGKTTLTNAIIHEISVSSPDERLILIEDTGELQCSSKNFVPLRAVDHVNMTHLLKATLRLRPDRIIVGEVRDGAALALLKAWNTGHPGGIATVHANSAGAGITRIEQLVAEASISPMQSLIAEAVNLIIYIEKTNSGRQVREIMTVDGFEKTYLTQILGK